ncbi:hypothetical protein BGZ92_001734 [Podila epicladia]|nr:hypothetical protein BGZ92_001734 [Podila epicladia]
MYPLTNTPESPTAAPHNFFGTQSHEPRLEPFCALIQHLYMGIVALEIDLRGFFLMHRPITLRKYTRDWTNVNLEILAAPVRKVAWLELHELAHGDVPSNRMFPVHNSYVGPMTVPVGAQPSFAQNPGIPSPLVRFNMEDMKNAKTLDFAFQFKNSDTNILVALWVHQDRLSYTGNFAELFQIPQPREVSQSLGGRMCKFVIARYNNTGTASYDCVVRSITAHCVLMKYTYTNELRYEVDLRDFCITGGDARTPVQQMSSDLSDQAFLAELLANPLRLALKNDIIQSATNYKMWELVQKCKEKLFDFAFVFKYPLGKNNLVAVWTHQAVPATGSKVKRVYRIPDMDSVSPFPASIRILRSNMPLRHTQRSDTWPRAKCSLSSTYTTLL